MNLKQIDFSKLLKNEQVYDHMMASYDQIGKHWVVHQWNWMNNIYKAFKDHYKYLIIISLVERTLQIYDQMNIKYTFDQFYSKSYLQIDKFSISELCQKLQLPKETVRRKVLELEKLGVLKRTKKRLVIDRSVFSQVKPERQIKLTSKYIFLISQILNKDKIYSKRLDLKMVEGLVNKNFSMCWRWFYRMQIPMVICYHNVFGDVATFHIWGTIVMNQVYNYKRNSNNSNIISLTPDYKTFNKGLFEREGASMGISAMSISDMTDIPRATVIRKCKFLIDSGYLKFNEKKQYLLSGLNLSTIVPYQKQIFREKANFLRKVLNLATIS
jgi:hypothetical protein